MTSNATSGRRDGRHDARPRRPHVVRRVTDRLRHSSEARARLSVVPRRGRRRTLPLSLRSRRSLRSNLDRRAQIAFAGAANDLGTATSPRTSPDVGRDGLLAPGSASARTPQSPHASQDRRQRRRRLRPHRLGRATFNRRAAPFTVALKRRPPLQNPPPPPSGIRETTSWHQRRRS